MPPCPRAKRPPALTLTRTLTLTLTLTATLPGSSALSDKIDAMERCLKQLVGVVQSLSTAMGERTPAGGAKEYVGGYQQGFADGYSRGVREVSARD
eukprot:scaffold33838_cov45-Phaeocystis_antarctica.AAC.1